MIAHPPELNQYEVTCQAVSPTVSNLFFLTAPACPALYLHNSDQNRFRGRWLFNTVAEYD
jgi:hypothetical protein